MKTFDDLVFGEPQGQSSKQATLDFDNGYGVSVITGGISYSTPGSPYELAVTLGGRLCYSTPITSDVMGYLKPNEVTEIMKRVQGLPKASK